MICRKKFILLSIISILLLLISLSHNIFAESGETDYLIRGFSGGFYYINNDNNTANCTSIESNGAATKVFSQSSARITKAVTSKSNLYLLVEEQSSTDSSKIIFTLSGDGSRNSIYSVEGDVISSSFTADDNYFYFIAETKDTIIKISRSQKSSVRISLGETAENLFYYDESVFALTSNSIINLENINKTIKSDIPHIPSSGTLTFYENKCIDDNSRLYSFDKNGGFQYIKSLNYSKCFILANTCCGISENCIYMLSESGEKIGKYACPSNINDACVNEQRAAILYSGNIAIISLKDFTAIKNEDPQSGNNSSTDRDNNSNNGSDANDDFSKYSIIDNYIVIPEGTTIAAIKKSIIHNDNSSLIFHGANGKEITSGKAGTGASLEYYNNNVLQKEYTIIIEGDLTGEGSVNTRDTRALMSYLLDESDLSEAQKLAADLDYNNIIDSVDLLLLTRRHK